MTTREPDGVSSAADSAGWPNASGAGRENQGEANGPRLEVLLVAHDPADEPEASIVLGALAGIGGIRCDGAPLADAGHGASLAELSRETGLHVGAVRRSIATLLGRGLARRDERGLHAVPDAVAARWLAHPRSRIRLPRAVRGLGLRAEPLLLAGLVHGQAQQGRLVLGVEYLAERLGYGARTVKRALATAEQAGAMHRWSYRTGGGGRQLVTAPGRRKEAPERQRKEAPESDGKGGTIAKRPHDRREEAPRPSRRGPRHPDCIRSTHGSPSGARACARAGPAAPDVAFGAG